jgi:hypothetical protein
VEWGRQGAAQLWQLAGHPELGRRFGQAVREYYRRSGHKTLVQSKVEDVEDPVERNRIQAMRWLGSHQCAAGASALRTRIARIVGQEMTARNSMFDGEVATAAQALGEIGDRSATASVKAACGYLRRGAWRHPLFDATTVPVRGPPRLRDSGGPGGGTGRPPRPPPTDRGEAIARTRGRVREAPAGGLGLVESRTAATAGGDPPPARDWWRVRTALHMAGSRLGSTSSSRKCRTGGGASPREHPRFSSAAPSASVPVAVAWRYSPSTTLTFTDRMRSRSIAYSFAAVRATAYSRRPYCRHGALM